MRVTMEHEEGSRKIFEFESSQSCSILGHKVTVLDRPEENVVVRKSAADPGRRLTITQETLGTLKNLIEGGWQSLGDGRTEEVRDMTGYFVLDGYGDKFYFANESRALRSYVQMGEKLKALPAAQIPRTGAVLALFNECARLLQQNGVEQSFFSLLP